MTVPLVAVQAFASLLHAEIQSSSEKSSREHQLRLIELEQALPRERLRAQAAIASQLIATAQHVFDRKLDTLQSSFTSVMKIIEAALSDLQDPRGPGPRVATRSIHQAAATAIPGAVGRIVAGAH